MDKNHLGILLGTIIALILLILGVSIQRWPCIAKNSTISHGILTGCISPDVSKNNEYLAIGVLLAFAIILVALALIFIFLDLTINDYRWEIVAIICIFLGALLALIAMLIYYIGLNEWISPILATIGMAFAVAVTIFMVMRRLAC
ncbi:unnamed protein product [Dibothriocephalus latus]|uniref:Transmembrane protein n=1 Tax=Dibothriocephalus latus TaxID=60516 RepID=A0A3P6Q9P4_DIBLA|nr:unnamed protein product [Dibothriocephalus latus]